MSKLSMEEYRLKRALDCKLVFDVLADGGGKVALDVLKESWPKDCGRLPRGYLKEWSDLASTDGHLDWNAFSSGLEKCMRTNRFRLGKRELKSPSRAEEALNILQGGREIEREPPAVSSGDMKQFLTTCEREPLVEALARTRRDAFSCQRTLHTLTNPATAHAQRNQVRRWSSLAPREPPVVGDFGNPTDKGGSPCSEREEVERGLDVLHRAERWYSNRLKYLALQERTQERMPQSKEVQAEGLLAALEGGTQLHNTLSHVQTINAHLSALTAVSPPTPSGDTHSLPLHNFLSSTSRHTASGRVPRRSHSMNPADHTGRRRVQRSLSLKGPLVPSADQWMMPAQQYPLRTSVSLREFTNSSNGRAAMATGLPVTVEDHSDSSPQQPPYNL